MVNRPVNEVVFDTKNNFYPPIKRYKMNFETVSVSPLFSRGGKIKKEKGRWGRNYLTFFLC